MTAHELGAVAVATVRGESNVRVAYADPGSTQLPWMILSGANSGDWARVDHVTDVRPLVVLDPESLGGADNIVRSLRKCPTANSISLALASEVEAQTKPPRIGEPGLWGVVEADWAGNGETGIPRAEWVRVKGNYWASSISGVHAEWDELLDPVLVREGVES